MIFLDEVSAGFFLRGADFLASAVFGSSFVAVGLAAFALVGLAVLEDLAVPFLEAAGFAAVGFVADGLSNAFALAVDFFEADDAEFATDRAKGNLNE